MKTKKFKISGKAEFRWSKIVEVDEEDTPENYNPPIYLDEVADYDIDEGDTEITIESVEHYSKKKSS